MSGFHFLLAYSLVVVASGGIAGHADDVRAELPESPVAVELPAPGMNEETPNESTESVVAEQTVEDGVAPPFSRLLITQTARVHRRIALFLDELRTGVPASEPRIRHRWSSDENEGILSTIVR